MDPRQTKMPTGVRRVHRNNDYTELFPARVFPTGEFDILERGGNLLVIKSYEHAAKVMPPHRKIYDLLVAAGNLPDAAGNITIVCVWGLGETPREFVVFDHRGEHPRRVVDIDGWRAFLLDWWHSARGTR